MSKAVGQKKFRGDAVWTKNAVTHLVWKLSAYGKALLDNEMKFLTATNLVHHLLKCYNREFEDGQRSFFQRVLEKDTPAGAHFVGVLAGIRREDKSNVTNLAISDG